MIARILLFCVFGVGAPWTARADPMVLYDGLDGVTCDYFNAGARVKWRNRLGDWRDAKGQAQGDTPFALANVDDLGTSRTIDWDITALVRGWLAGTYRNAGLLLDLAKGSRGGTSDYFSREAESAAARPRLVIAFADGQRMQLPAAADAWLDCSTVSALGDKNVLKVGGGPRAALYFDLEKLQGRKISRATLQLVTTSKQYGSTTVAVYRIDPPGGARPPPRPPGIAAAHPGDQGISKHPDVLMATGFDSALWHLDWSYLGVSSHAERIDHDDIRRFEPLRNHALRVKIPQGANLGLDLGYSFGDKVGAEPEEIYFRYYLRFADDWNPPLEGGKLPGIAGTYGKAGWGGRKADANLGWSMRGLFHRAMPPANPFHGRTAIGTYAYHASGDDFWGDNWDWGTGDRGLLRRNRWYCIEQYFRVNTVGRKDGVFRAWIDDEPVFARSDIRVRDTASIKIEKIWMNVYHGGTAKSPQDLHLYIDNVVVARKPIGCMRP